MPQGKEMNGSFKEAKISDWPGEKVMPRDWPTEKSEIPDWSRQKNATVVDFQKRNFLDAWEPDGVEGDLSNEEGPGRQLTDEEDLGTHRIGQEGPSSHQNGQEDPASHKIGQEDSGNHMIGQDSITDNTTAAHKHKGDDNQTEVRTSAIGRLGVEVEDDWWDGEGRPTGERWPPLGAPDDQAEDGGSFDSW